MEGLDLVCGICGEMRFAGAPVVHEHIFGMRESLVHRGPDDSGLYLSPDGRAGLGFRRLRIVDLSPQANQPMGNEDGSVRLVFNGEIYNFPVLREQLLARGHRFRSHADSEVIVHLFEERGADCVHELEGMFALAVWDGRTRRLTLARDRSGKKPLFYYQDAERIAFASEIKAFFAHPEIPIEVNQEAIPYYFIHGYVPCPETFYRGVRQIEPATSVTIDATGVATRRVFWRLQRSGEAGLPGASNVDRPSAQRRVRELLTKAVERRLISDVPIGAFLSGGIDSTIVVGLMSELMQEPVKTFSIGFEGDPAYDETRYARIAAAHFGTDHTEFRVTPSAVDLVEKLVWHHDGPFGDSSAVPTYIVSELTRQHVTVALTGDGGDELFAGYHRFYAAVVAEHIPPSIRRALTGVLARPGESHHGRHWRSRARRFLSAMNLPLYERLTRWSSLFYDDVEQLLSSELLASIRPIERVGYLSDEIEHAEGLSPLTRLLRANFVRYLLDDLLVKTDRCSMACALEARSPFLDRELVEYVMALPDNFKLRRGRNKVILRDACADLVPREIARRGKMGFGVPLGAWFRGELREYLDDYLLSRDAAYRSYLSPEFVAGLVRRHREGPVDLSLQLWSLLTFEIWLRQLPGWVAERRAEARTRADSASYESFELLPGRP